MRLGGLSLLTSGECGALGKSSAFAKHFHAAHKLASLHNCSGPTLHRIHALGHIRVPLLRMRVASNEVSKLPPLKSASDSGAGASTDGQQHRFRAKSSGKARPLPVRGVLSRIWPALVGFLALAVSLTMIDSAGAASEGSPVVPCRMHARMLRQCCDDTPCSQVLWAVRLLWTAGLPPQGNSHANERGPPSAVLVQSEPAEELPVQHSVQGNAYTIRPRLQMVQTPSAADLVERCVLFRAPGSRRLLDGDIVHGSCWANSNSRSVALCATT